MKKYKSLEYDILNILKHESDGLKLAVLANKMGIDSDDPTVRRSLQRSLKILTENGSVIPLGNARSRIYVFVGKQKISTPKKENSSLPKEIIFSTDAEKLFKYISQPVTNRIPVGYKQSFLKDYIPNKTFYLSEKQKEELLKLGRVDISKQPAGTYARDILNRLIIDLSWNSSRLEGNTYSLLETKRLIEFGEFAEGRNATEAQMILNHKAAIEFMIDSANEIDFDSLTLCNLQALLSDNLLGDPSASGRLRERPVEIAGSVYLPIDNPHFLNECFELLLRKVKAIKNPFEQCFFTLVHLSYLQAFEDVNKRTSRLAANIPLIKQNLKPLAFVDVPQDLYLKALLGIYEQNDFSLFKDLFMWAYKRSTQKYSAIQQSLGEPNLLKLKHREKIHKIIQKLIKDKTQGRRILKTLSHAIEEMNLPREEAKKVLEILELEIASLHEGNIARYQIRPSEYREWVKLK
jgi:Fic family protein